jgi:hypothetical protein
MEYLDAEDDDAYYSVEGEEGRDEWHEPGFEQGPSDWDEPGFERRRPRTEDSELLDELYRDIEARTQFNRARTQHVNALTTMLPVRKERIRRLPRPLAASTFMAVSHQHGAVLRRRSGSPAGVSPPLEHVAHPPCGGRLRLARSVVQSGFHDEPRSPTLEPQPPLPALAAATATAGRPAARLAKRNLVFSSPEPESALRASFAQLSLARERPAPRRPLSRTESAPAELRRASPTGTALAAARFDPTTRGAFAAARVVETGLARRQPDGGGSGTDHAEGSPQGYDIPPRRAAGRFAREQLARQTRSHPASAELRPDSPGVEPSLASHSAPELLELVVSPSECAHEITLANDAPYFPHSVSNPRLRLEQRLVSVRARGRRSLDAVSSHLAAAAVLDGQSGIGAPACLSSSTPTRVAARRQPAVVHHARPRRLHAL